jgi:hypothetical protein
VGLIEQAPVSTYRSPTIVSGVLPVKVGLHGSVARVQTGTPLRPLPQGGWGIAKDGLGELICTEGQWGGEIITAWRCAAVDFHRLPTNRFTIGARYRVADVDDKGVPEFELDDNGAFVALDHTTMLMDMTVAALYGRAAARKDTAGA